MTGGCGRAAEDDQASGGACVLQCGDSRYDDGRIHVSLSGSGMGREDVEVSG